METVRRRIPVNLAIFYILNGFNQRKNSLKKKVPIKVN